MLIGCLFFLFQTVPFGLWQLNFWIRVWVCQSYFVIAPFCWSYLESWVNWTHNELWRWQPHRDISCLFVWSQTIDSLTISILDLLSTHGGYNGRMVVFVACLISNFGHFFNSHWSMHCRWPRQDGGGIWPGGETRMRTGLRVWLRIQSTFEWAWYPVS